MPEFIHPLELHSIQGPHAEQRQTALNILIRRMNQLEAEINELKRINPAKAYRLVNELEAVIVQAEKIVADEVLIDEVERVIEGGKIKTIQAKTPEGREIKFELKERLEYWRNFYKENGVDWITLPNEITVTEEQEKEMIRLITEFGFDHMIIIPDNIVGQPEIEKFVDEKGTTQKRLKKPAEHYERLAQKMTQGEGYEKNWQTPEYQKEGGFGGSSDKMMGLRIILTKDVQNLDYDKLFKKTVRKSVDELESSVGILKENGLSGWAESEYLVYQREYFKRTKKHLDEKGWTWLLNSVRFVSARVLVVYWHSINGHLVFNSFSRAFQDGDIGARLAGHFSL